VTGDFLFLTGVEVAEEGFSAGTGSFSLGFSSLGGAVDIRKEYQPLKRHPHTNTVQYYNANCMNIVTFCMVEIEENRYVQSSNMDGK